jgi:hypothetical protein
MILCGEEVVVLITVDRDLYERQDQSENKNRSEPVYKI